MAGDPKCVGETEMSDCASTAVHCYYILRINAYTGRFRGWIGPYRHKEDAESDLAKLKSIPWNEDDGSKLLEVPVEVLR